MEFFSLPFWQGFLGNLLATIIGVVVGIPIAFWINRRVESATEREKKQKILEVLLGDLEDILAFVVEWRKDMEKTSIFKPIPGINQIPDETWRAFSDGGELQWIRDPILLRRLAWCYASINYTKFLSEKYLDFMYNINLINFFQFFVFVPAAGINIRNNMKDLENTITETIDAIKENLK